MMEKINIPFLPEFEGPMLLGKKTMTCRTKRYGYPGDWFEAFGRTFILTRVSKLLLETVEHHYYPNEGFDTRRAFIAAWRKLHPRKGFNPEQTIFAHEFRSQRDLAVFHVHEMSCGRCSICGFEPVDLTKEEQM